MNKKISWLHLCLTFILLILSAIGIIRSSQLSQLIYLSVVGVIWIFCCILYFNQKGQSWLGFSLFVLTWSIFPLLRFIAAYLLPWSADALLTHIDQALWNGRILSDFFRYEDYPILSDLITLCYFFFYFLVLGSVIYFTFKRQTHVAYTFFNYIILLYCIGFIGYLSLPAAGPAFTLSPQQGGGGVITQAITAMINDGVTGMDVFPSLHTAISVFIVGYLYQLGYKAMSFCLVPIVGGTIFATIFLRYHYGIDVLTGALIAIILLISSFYALKTQQNKIT